MNKEPKGPCAKAVQVAQSDMNLALTVNGNNPRKAYEWLDKQALYRQNPNAPEIEVRKRTRRVNGEEVEEHYDHDNVPKWARQGRVLALEHLFE